MATNLDFINADGSYNVAAIMPVAHRHARHGRNKTICTLAGHWLRCPLGAAEAEFARVAATVDVSQLTIPASLSYAAELKRALIEAWRQARVMRARFVPAPVVIAFRLAA